MNFKLIPAALTLFACTAVSAQSAPAETGPWVMGAGAGSCGKLLSAVRTKNELGVQQYVTWTQGFLSGVNWSKIKGAKNLKVDPEAVRAYLIKYCQDKPLDDVFNGVDLLTLELFGKQ